MSNSGRRAKSRRTGGAAVPTLAGTALPCPPEYSSITHELFGERTDTAARFAGHLAVEGPIRGLVGPREVPRLWERHLLNCAVLSELVPPGVSIADVGSGAGLPGLVLAIARPDLEVCLIEPMLRRTTWLAEVSQVLGLTNVRVLRARAETVPKGLRFDVVTARAVAALGSLIPLCLPLVRPGGVLLAMKGSRAQEEVIDASAVLAQNKLVATVLPLGEGKLEEPTMAVRLDVP